MMSRGLMLPSTDPTLVWLDLGLPSRWERSISSIVRLAPAAFAISSTNESVDSSEVSVRPDILKQLRLEYCSYESFFSSISLIFFSRSTTLDLRPVTDDLSPAFSDSSAVILSFRPSTTPDTILLTREES
ncbi:hypothetical protein DPMN_005709 [Dreissena polymorpha]|uniref:Uncharacterized protein n=1 Tax=Dreissena polymorpha TaxID=45954 RepID=A0A9D4MQ62_DREPO|nr:hypothetical protein DPMN_005709 [Dreissena polymorpha]